MFNKMTVLGVTFALCSVALAAPQKTTRRAEQPAHSSAPSVNKNIAAALQSMDVERLDFRLLQLPSIAKACNFDANTRKQIDDSINSALKNAARLVPPISLTGGDAMYPDVIQQAYANRRFQLEKATNLELEKEYQRFLPRMEPKYLYRLRQVMLQARGPNLPAAKVLGLSQAQIKILVPALQKAQAKAERSGNDSTRLSASAKEVAVVLHQNLTPTQLKLWAQMVGKPVS